MKLGRLFRTVRHLRPGQLTHRVKFRLARPKPDLSPPPPLRPAPAGWVRPAERAPSLLGPTRFRFLNETADLAEFGWDDPSRAKLWRYNQHYFDDLNARDAGARAEWHRALIAAWIAGNPPARGTGWEPYPASLRIVNWVKWALAGNPLSAEAVQSLAVQTRWLTRRLEWHLLGNHLFANAKALVFAGLYFEGAEAERWLAQGLAILDREVPEQILPDGGQFELSPMYHALAVEDVLDLLNLLAARRDDLPEEGRRLDDMLRRRIGPMLTWMSAMAHPDGGIAFFNDAAFGIAPDNAELLAYTARLGLTFEPKAGACIDLPESGYVRLAAGPAVLIADVAKVGPDYLPAHGHADALSFELSLGGERLIVNSGTSVYGDGPERQRQRGTAAHSTLALAGLDSSEMWGGFRVGRRARVRREMLGETSGVLTLAASHDGYAHLSGGPRHRRTWRLKAAGLRITDDILGQGKVYAAIHFHLAPHTQASIDSDGAVLLFVEGRAVATLRTSGAAALHQSTWHPEFGLSQPNHRIEIDASGPMPRTITTELTWEDE